jgi:hypothetical protein
MKIRRPHLIVGAAVIALALAATVAHTRAVQEWYDTVTVQGKMTAYLLDDRAAINGLLLDGGQQVRLNPRLRAASRVASRRATGCRRPAAAVTPRHSGASWRPRR